MILFAVAGALRVAGVLAIDYAVHVKEMEELQHDRYVQDLSYHLKNMAVIELLGALVFLAHLVALACAMCFGAESECCDRQGTISFGLIGLLLVELVSLPT